MTYQYIFRQHSIFFGTIVKFCVNDRKQTIYLILLKKNIYKRQEIIWKIFYGRINNIITKISLFLKVMDWWHIPNNNIPQKRKTYFILGIQLNLFVVVVIVSHHRHQSIVMILEGSSLQKTNATINSFFCSWNCLSV